MNAIELGTVFLLQAEGAHPRVVISDSSRNPDRVVVVGISTVREGKEMVCVLDAGECPLVTHRSCVLFRYALVVTLPALYDARDRGDLQVHGKAPDGLLQRIWAGANRSQLIPEEALDVLLEQGLLPDGTPALGLSRK